uniref:DUF4378 domain-containing protein n=1 Tax=Oryza punctata TaxID=4537 RepID=A0A0E0KHD0_ORYPU
MAAARRLSELLQEQQEPFLIEAAKFRRLRRGRVGGGGGGGGGGGACCPVAACRRLFRLCNPGFKKRRGGGGGGVGGSGVNGLRSALSKALCGKAMRRVLRWDNLGCFPGGGDREFRRLRRSTGDSGECDPRAMDFGRNNDDDERPPARWKADIGVDMDVDELSRQLSPVSVLDLHSDDDGDSPVHCRWEDEKPSTSGSSPPSEDFIGATSPCFTYNIHGKIIPMEVEDDDEEEMARAGKSIEEQISSWERIAEDISNIPRMVEMDFSQSIQRWSELKLEAAMEIGTRIETLIFDEIRKETVCDMLASHCTLATTTSC